MPPMSPTMVAPARGQTTHVCNIYFQPLTVCSRIPLVCFQILLLPGDVTNEESVKSIIQRSFERFKRLDILVGILPKNTTELFSWKPLKPTRHKIQNRGTSGHKIGHIYVPVKQLDLEFSSGSGTTRVLTEQI